MLEKILRWIIICGVFAVPLIALVVTPSLEYPTVTGKSFAFRIIVEIILAAWVVLVLVHERYRPRQSLILGTFTVFVVVMAIADAHGVNPSDSFWGNFRRMDGWITLMHVFAYLVVASSVIASEKAWRTLFQVSLCASVIVSIYGLLQLTGILPLSLGGQAGLSARVDSTIGNPIFLAVYLLFHIFFAALLLYQTWVAQPTKERLAALLIYVAVILIDTTVLFFTGARGAMLGLIGGAVLTLIILAFVQGLYRLRMMAVATLITIVFMGGCLSLARDTSLVQSTGSLHRLTTISLSDSTIKSRLVLMSIAWQGVKEKPILGWGQENYKVVFAKDYDPRMYGSEPWYDRAHNIILDWFVAGGVLGLLAYLSIFGATLWVLWMRNVLSIPERAILTGLLAAYTINNLAIFDTITSYILFATILAYIVFRERDTRGNVPLFAEKVVSPKTLWSVTVIVAIVTCGAIWRMNAVAISANRALVQAIAPQDTYTKNLGYLKQAIAYGSLGTQDARDILYLLALVLGGEEVPNEIKQQYFDTANRELQLQSVASPLDAHIPFSQGTLLNRYGDYAGAEIALQHAHELAPKMQLILFMMAENAHARGDYFKEFAYYREAYDLDPNNIQAAQLYTTAMQPHEFGVLTNLILRMQ